MEQEQIIHNLRKQLLIERISFGVIALVLVAGWSWGHLRDTTSLIVIDGKPVVCVPSEREATDILQQIKSRAGGNLTEVQFKQQVCVARAPRGAQPVSRHKAMRIVQGMVSPLVPKWAIIADGQPVVAVPSREVAGEVLDLAKLKFGKIVANLAEEPQFKQNIRVDVAAVSPSIYRKTAREAVEYVFSERAPVMQDGIYIVRGGDIASSIAARNGLSLEDLRAMNARTDLDRLQIGDKLRIKTTAAPKARLTVVVRDQDERVESIPAPVQRVSSARVDAGRTVELSSGRSGRRQITVATIYENGRKVGSEIIDEQTLREPVSRQIAVGIRSR